MGADRVGPASLVIIDEAGMADTLTLDAVVAYALARGASVRLVGDDAQLAAVGAGGVLRDIAATHGAVRLREVVRFADPAEAAASLALREGLPEALGYYLDHDRVHVGDLATALDDALHRLAGRPRPRAWTPSCSPPPATWSPTSTPAPAPTASPAPPHAPDEEVALADGNRAGVGDLVITRRNDRRLAVSDTDWVRNGDRWLVPAPHRDGGLRVRHVRHHLHVTLPADYVAAAVDLGYATTIHTAQGLTADTMHGVLTGAETRQQLYTLATRGRLANHLYLDVLGPGRRRRPRRRSTPTPCTHPPPSTS